MAAMTYRVEVTGRENGNMIGTAEWGVEGLENARLHRLYFLQGNVTSAEVAYLAEELLADPVMETAVIETWASVGLMENGQVQHIQTIEMTLLPGVTDPPAENLLRSAHLLGINRLTRVATGQRYLLDGRLPAADLDCDYLRME